MSFERHELRSGEDGYPASLYESPHPPEVLYIAGDPAAVVDGLAVIGARRATPYGLRAARQFAGWAAENGVSVISGAAHGCDQTAQQAAVDAGGSSIAVLGCGADVDYPPSSKSLLGHLRANAAVVSEVPWGREPTRYAFPERNRLIAALSRAVLIVEAALPSGTFSTASHAIDMNRDLLVVPGSIFAPECRGTNRLLSSGATVISDVSELAQALRSAGLIDGEPHSGSIVVDATDPVARALIASPMRPDDVARELALDIVDVARRIARLEAGGIVSRYRDGRYGVAKEMTPTKKSSTSATR